MQDMLSLMLLWLRASIYSLYNYISINYYNIFIIELLFVSIDLELIKYKNIVEFSIKYLLIKL